MEEGRGKMKDGRWKMEEGILKEDSYDNYMYLILYLSYMYIMISYDDTITAYMYISYVSYILCIVI